ncbi:hypothetical protein [Pseudomonas sp. NPDC089734]|uniref:hypothetical protein n=1 Tax=Pseudomonas sp. NPDC089734 TaxID=3364469 RepID=UPI00380A5415
MSNSARITEGIQKRREYLRSKRQIAKVNPSEADELVPPVVDAILPGSPDGLLPVAALQADLDIKIPYWGVPLVGTQYADVTLSLIDSQDQIVYSNIKRFNAPLTGADFPLQHDLPQGNIPHEGTFTLEYLVALSVGNENNSDPRTIVIDRTPPYYNPNPELALPAALVAPSTVITDATFSGGVTEFVCTLPEYADINPEDRVVVFWGPGLPDTPDTPNPVFGPVTIPADRKIPIPKAYIETLPNGTTYAVYWLVDKAGNWSSISKPLQVDVQLGALPADLKDPQVPLGPLVDLADAHMTVEVLIPAFSNPADSFIAVKWGATPLGEVAPGSTSRDTYIPVPWSVLKAEYTGGPGEEDVRVSYQVRRGTLLFPQAALYVDIEVDFSTIGPGNPNEPDPVNPNLDQIHLTGAAGGQDVLTPQDAGKDIVATVALYDPVLPTEVLELYWGTQETPVDDFTVVNERPGDLIDFTIPWTAIEPQANNPALPMYYTINSADGNNPQQSPDTPVEVNVLVLGFDPVSFPDVYEDDLGNRTLSCESLYSEDYDNPTAKFGFRVAVPGDRDLKVGDVVTAVWQGYELDETTTIPGTRFTHTHPALTQEEVTNGFTFLVEPYADHILPIETGYAEVSYTVTPVGGGTPVPSDPMPEKQAVSVVRPGGFFCVVPPPKP